jgi:regulator of protease activity HflC (stomatin/prohibitin superfamily)
MDAILGLLILLLVAVVGIFVVVSLLRSVRVIPQARAAVVERFGRYLRTLEPGLALVLPFADRVRPLVDLRERVVSFPPQPVITEDNLLVNIDTVIYFQVTDPKDATYEIQDFIQGIEQLTVTTLRNVVGSMNLEQALTGRDHVNGQLRAVLDETTGRWGIRVNRVELKAIEPPASIRDSMEKQMRAERDRRAAILTAEGVKQSKILTAQGEKEAAILRAQGDRESRILQAEGQAQAIETVFNAIHEGRPDPELLAYQYLQTLPQIAQGDANKLWIIPSEVGKALEGLSGAIGRIGDVAKAAAPPAPAAKPVRAEIQDADAYAKRPEVIAAEKAVAEATANVAGTPVLGKIGPNGQQTP